jgi:hypothetical protein
MLKVITFYSLFRVFSKYLLSQAYAVLQRLSNCGSQPHGGSQLDMVECVIYKKSASLIMKMRVKSHYVMNTSFTESQDTSLSFLSLSLSLQLCYGSPTTESDSNTSYTT